MNQADIVALALKISNKYNLCNLTREVKINPSLCYTIGSMSMKWYFIILLLLITLREKRWVPYATVEDALVEPTLGCRPGFIVKPSAHPPKVFKWVKGIIFG